MSDITAWGIGTKRVNAVATLCEAMFTMGGLSSTDRLRILSRISELTTNSEAQEWYEAILAQDTARCKAIQEAVAARFLRNESPIAEEYVPTDIVTAMNELREAVGGAFDGVEDVVAFVDDIRSGGDGSPESMAEGRKEREREYEAFDRSNPHS